LLGQLTWEIDIWGRIRDQVAAAKSGAQANEDLLAATRLSLQASLARTYIALRGADAQAALLARTIKIYQEALKLTQERLDKNIAPPIDVERAKVALASTQAAASDIAQGRAVIENAVAVLAGETASFLRIKPEARQPETPRLPRVAPAVLLLRRPDVAANERLLFAANENIGAAKADFLPRFNLLISGGTQSTNLDLLNFHNSLWSYGPSVTAPVFDGGQRQAALEIARSDFRVAAANYKGSVLAAYQEVEDATASIKLLGEENRSLAVASTAAQRALDMSMALYKDGAVSSLDVVTSQSAALEAQRAQIAAAVFPQYCGAGPARAGSRSGDDGDRRRSAAVGQRPEGGKPDGSLRPMRVLENGPSRRGLLPPTRASANRRSRKDRPLADDPWRPGLRRICLGRRRLRFGDLRRLPLSARRAGAAAGRSWRQAGLLVGGGRKMRPARAYAAVGAGGARVLALHSHFRLLRGRPRPFALGGWMKTCAAIPSSRES
jgi:hypothetical protein